MSQPADNTTPRTSTWWITDERTHGEPGLAFVSAPWHLEPGGIGVLGPDEVSEGTAEQVRAHLAARGYTVEIDESDHECPKQVFLDDPITRASGMGSEMVGLIACPVCDAREADQ